MIDCDHLKTKIVRIGDLWKRICCSCNTITDSNIKTLVGIKG